MSKIDYIEVSDYIVNELLSAGLKYDIETVRGALSNYISDKPTYNPDGTRKNDDKTRLNSMLTDEKLQRLIQRSYEARLPKFKQNINILQKQAAFEAFKQLPLPAREEALRAFTWFICPSSKEEFKNNLVKFDAFCRHLGNTIFPDVHYLVDPTMLLFYSESGRTGKTFRVQAIEKTVQDLGFPTQNTTSRALFENGFHSADDFIDGLSVINEWSNDFNLADDLLKNLVEQNPIRYNAKYRNSDICNIKTCIVGASNYRIKTNIDRRISMLSFADCSVPYPTDPEYAEFAKYEFVTEEEKNNLFKIILQVYFYFYQKNKLTDLTEESEKNNNKAFLNKTFLCEKLLNTLNVGNLNTLRPASGFRDGFMAYVDSVQTFPVVISPQRCAIYFSRHKYGKFRQREFDNIINELLNQGLVTKMPNNQYQINNNDTNTVLSHLQPQCSSERYSYQETYLMLEEILGLDFLEIPKISAKQRLNATDHPFDKYHETPDGEYECINDFKSLTPTDGHKTIRTMDNVCYSRFLFEIDGINGKTEEECLETQYKIAYDLHIQGALYRAVFSGKKSVHMILELEPINSDIPLTIDEYKFVWKLLAKKYGLEHADPACNEPARLTRRPKVRRKDTGKMQELLYFDKNKVSLKWRAEYIQTQAVRKTSTNSFLPNCLNSNVAEFITNYMKKNNLEYKPDFRHRTVCSVRGALAKAGIQYSDQDLLDYGFEEKYVSNTANLSFDALAE